MQPEEIQQLVQRYLEGTATPDEKRLLDQWYQEGQSDPVKWFAESEHEEELLRLEMLAEIQKRTGLKKSAVLKRLWPRIAAAASILIVVSIGAFSCCIKSLWPSLLITTLSHSANRPS